MENLEKQFASKDEKKITVIEIIDNFLKTNFDEVYQIMVDNEKVRSAGFEPSKEQFGQYCLLLKKGLEYVSSKYGKTALPENLCFYTGEMQAGNSFTPDFIGYMSEKDELGISFLHIAGQCARYNEPRAKFIDHHLPEGHGVIAEDYTTLQAIEEGYHRHQIKQLGFKPEDTRLDRDHPAEKEVIKIFQVAIEDLGIKLYKLESEQ
jgi:hypothetical protein